MPLSWNEIRSRSLAFSREWANESSEDAEAERVAFLFTRYQQLVQVINSAGLKSNLKKVDRHAISPAEYAEIPELPEEFFTDGQMYRNGKPKHHIPGE